MERESRLKEQCFVIRHSPEQTSVLKREFREGRKPLRPGESDPRIYPKTIGVSVPLCDRLTARSLESSRILANLERQIDQGDDDCDAADEVSEVSKCFENVVLLTRERSGAQLQVAERTDSTVAGLPAGRKVPRSG